MAKTLDDVPSVMSKDKRPADVVNLYKFPKNKFVTIRMEDPIESYAGHWVKGVNKEGKPATFFAVCTKYDRETWEYDSTKKCAWCAYTEKMGTDSKENPSGVQNSVEFFANAIHRKEQDNQPRKLPRLTKQEEETGFKDKESDSWTPVVVVRFTKSVANQVKDLRQLNVHEDPKSGESRAYAVTDRRFGMDIHIKHNPDAAPAQQYAVQAGDVAPITKEERTYLRWNLTDLMTIPSEKDNEENFKRWLKATGRTVKGKRDEEEDEDEFGIGRDVLA